MLATNKYQYPALAERGCIRILQLQPGSKNDDINCSITNELLEPSSDYAAVSYTWAMNESGDASLSRSILIDGKVMGITQNLHDGLRRIRDRHSNRRLWVDAICIDQSNITERNEQVAQMAQVYQYASKVLVWLGEGPSEEEDKLVLTLWQWTESRVPVADLFKEDAKIMLEEPVRVVLARAIVVQSGESEPLEKARLETALPRCTVNLALILARFLNRRYFSRRWTFQELWHPSAEAIEILWGPCSYSGLKVHQEYHDHRGRQNGRLSWVLMHATDAFDDLELEYPTREDYRLMIRKALHNIAYLMVAIPRMEIQLPYDSLENTGNTGIVSTKLTKILDFLPKQYCSDDRDIIFASLSLAPDFGLAPDYRLSTVEIYTRFTRILIETGLLDLVLSNLVEPDDDEVLMDVPVLSGLPSWVPDLRRRMFKDPYAVYDRLESLVHGKDVLICHLYLIIPREQRPSYEEISMVLGQVRGSSRIKAVRSVSEYHHGDMICSTHGDKVGHTWNNSGYLVILRPSTSTPSRYRIIQVISDTELTKSVFTFRSQKIKIWIE